MRSDTSYWVSRRRGEDAALIASSNAAWLLRAELEASADEEETVFISGGHYLVLPAAEGDARGLRRAIAPKSDHDRIDAIVDGRREAVEPTEAEPLVIQFIHGSGGFGIDVLGLTGLLHRAPLGRPPQVEGKELADALLALAQQFRTDDYFSKGKPAVVVLVAYNRDGDYVGTRRLGVI